MYHCYHLRRVLGLAVPSCVIWVVCSSTATSAWSVCAYHCYLVCERIIATSCVSVSVLPRVWAYHYYLVWRARCSGTSTITCGEDGRVLVWDSRTAAEPHTTIQPALQQQLARPHLGKVMLPCKKKKLFLDYPAHPGLFKSSRLNKNFHYQVFHYPLDPSG